MTAGDSTTSRRRASDRDAEGGKMETGAHRLGDERLRQQYAAAGFGGRVGWGERPALLVIDMAAAWTDPAEQLGSDLSQVLESILRLLEVARGTRLADLRRPDPTST